MGRPLAGEEWGTFVQNIHISAGTVDWVYLCSMRVTLVQDHPEINVIIENHVKLERDE